MVTDSSIGTEAPYHIGVRAICPFLRSLVQLPESASPIGCQGNMKAFAMIANSVARCYIVTQSALRDKGLRLDSSILHPGTPAAVPIYTLI